MTGRPCPVPESRAWRFPLPGADSRTSASMPSALSLRARALAAAVSSAGRILRVDPDDVGEQLRGLVAEAGPLGVCGRDVAGRNEGEEEEWNEEFAHPKGGSFHRVVNIALKKIFRRSDERCDGLEAAQTKMNRRRCSTT